MRRRPLILSLSANPRGRGRLALDDELRDLERHLRPDAERTFDLHRAWAVRAVDLEEQLAKRRVAAIYFAGHGESTGIQLIGPDGHADPMSGAALARMIEASGAPVRLVVLNACDTADHARALVRVVEGAIGMGSKIGNDHDARPFAVALFAALDRGASVGEAFSEARAKMKEPTIARLELRDGVNANTLHVVFPTDATHRAPPPGLEENEVVLGRERTIAQIRERLRTTRFAHERCVIALTGLAGVGKTSVARACAWAEHLEHSSEVIWVDTSPSLFGSSVMENAPGDHGVAEALTTIAERVAAGATLFIDNADGTGNARTILRAVALGNVVVTTRDATFAADEVVEIGVLAPRDAVELLMRAAHSDDRRSAECLAEAFGYLPLALAQIGEYAFETPSHLADYLARVNRFGIRTSRSPIEAIADVLAISGPELEATIPLAMRVLQLFATLGAERLARPNVASFLRDIMGTALEDDDKVRVAIAALRRHSLVHATPSTIAVHPLVREVVLAAWAPTERVLAQENTVFAFDRLIKHKAVNTEISDIGIAAFGGLDVEDIAARCKSHPKRFRRAFVRVARRLAETCLTEREDARTALVLFERAIAEFGHLDMNAGPRGVIMRAAARAASLVGDHVRARELSASAIAVAGDARSGALHDAAFVELAAKDFARARSLLLEVVAADTEHHTLSHARTLDLLGQAEMELAEMLAGEERVRFLELAQAQKCTALHIRIRLGSEEEQAMGAANLAIVLLARQDSRDHLLTARALLRYARGIYVALRRPWSDDLATITRMLLETAKALKDWRADELAWATTLVEARLQHPLKRRTNPTSNIANLLIPVAARQRDWRTAASLGLAVFDICAELATEILDLYIPLATLSVVAENSGEILDTELAERRAIVARHPKFEAEELSRYVASLRAFLT